MPVLKEIICVASFLEMKKPRLDSLQLKKALCDVLLRTQKDDLNSLLFVLLHKNQKPQRLLAEGILMPQTSQLKNHEKRNLKSLFVGKVSLRNSLSNV